MISPLNITWLVFTVIIFHFFLCFEHLEDSCFKKPVPVSCRHKTWYWHNRACERNSPRCAYSPQHTLHLETRAARWRQTSLHWSTASAHLWRRVCRQSRTYWTGSRYSEWCRWRTWTPHLTLTRPGKRPYLGIASARRPTSHERRRMRRSNSTCRLHTTRG